MRSFRPHLSPSVIFNAGFHFHCWYIHPTHKLSCDAGRTHDPKAFKMAVVELRHTARARLAATAFVRGIHFNAGSRTFQFACQPITPNDENTLFFRTGWDGPTGEFTSPKIIGAEFVRCNA